MRQLTFVGPKRLEWWVVPEQRLKGPAEAIVRPLIVAPRDLDRSIYMTGVTVRTGRVHARTEMPEIFALVRSGRFDPAPVTTAVVGWDDAPTALAGEWTKLVMVRE